MINKYVLALCLGLLVGACSAPTSHVENRGEDTLEWWQDLPRASWAQYERIEHSHPWFEAYRVEPGVIAIYEPGQFEEVISYLIVGSQRALLFDTGLGIGNLKQLVAELVTVPVTVLNSHSHYDHIGSNAQFDTILGSNNPFALERQEGAAHETVAEFVSDAWIWRPLPDGFDRESYAIKPYKVTNYVEEGDSIDLGGRRLHVIATPGHSPDSICLIDRENKLLFTGDTFYPAPLYTHLPESSFGDYRRSAAKLRALQPAVSKLFPGHNETGLSSDYLSKMDQAFRRVEAGGEPFKMSDGARQYQFEGFSILTKDIDFALQ